MGLRRISRAIFFAAMLASVGGCGVPTSPVRPTSAPSQAVPTQVVSPAPDSTSLPAPVSTLPPTPLPVRSEHPLSGLEADPQHLHWPPLVVMIPSDSEQYGMSQASVVYEAIAEYQVPRFLAIFEQMGVPKIGPIRSARPYHVDWACPYGPLFVHWGGSPQALTMLAEYDCIRPLDGQTYGDIYFWTEQDPQIPWNDQFTSSDLLSLYLVNWDIIRTVDYRGYEHKADAPLESRPLAGTISIDAFRHPVRYLYDRQSNTFLREYKDVPHLDLLTGEQHRVNNVVVVFVPTSPIPDDPKDRVDIATTGEGEAMFFLDGILIRGRWVKGSSEAEMRFLDEAGQEIAFNRGNIWIEVLAPGQEVSVRLGE